MEEIKFNEIKIEHKELFDDFLRRYPPEISEFTFTNLFCWRQAHKHRFAIFKEHLLVSSAGDND